MPNRILREGIIESEDVNKLSWPAEVFYRRLMSKVDDFGRYDANARLLRAALYPLKLDKVSDRDTQGWLQETEEAGLVKVYEVEGKRFLEVLKFKQQVRAKRSKYPAPPGTCTAHAQHMHSTCQARAQHMHTKTEAETESNNISMVGGNTTVDVGAAAAAPPPPPHDDEMPEGYRRWLAALCGAVPQLAAYRTLPAEAEAAARTAWLCLPQAAEHAPLLKAYYADRLQEDRRHTHFWRPMGAQFFVELGDVIFKHALRWQRETGWKPGAARSRQKPAEDPTPPTPQQLADQRAAWEAMKQDV